MPQIVALGITRELGPVLGGPDAGWPGLGRHRR